MRMLKAIILVVISCGLFGLGWFLRGSTSGPVVIHQNPIRWQPLNRDYDPMTRDELRDNLRRYDTDSPRLEVRETGRYSDSVACRATAGLADRNWYRDFTIRAPPVWRHQVSGGLGTILVDGRFYPAGLVGYSFLLGRAALGGEVVGCQRAAGIFARASYSIR